MVVYVDLVILLNVVVDFLLLLSVNRLTGYTSDLIRCTIGAVIGGVYGGLCLCCGLLFLQNWYWCVAVLGIIMIVSFGLKVSTIRRGALFMLLSMTLQRIRPVISSRLQRMVRTTMLFLVTVNTFSWVKIQLQQVQLL